MDQVSKPVLIALAAVLVFVAAHFTILAPKSGGSSSPASATAPGQAGLQSAIDKANNAVGVSKQSATRSEQAAAAASGDASSSAPSATASKPAASTPATGKAAKPVVPAKILKPLPKLEPGDRSGPILADLQHGKVVVALFFNPHGSDDNAALRAVRAADRHSGRVVIHSIPIGDVGDYNALTTGVQVLEAPTILVIGPNFKARTIVGYTEVKEVDQTVGDVGGKAFQPKAAKHLVGFAARASYICDGDGFKVLTSGLPTSAADLPGWLGHASTRLTHSRAQLAAVPASGAKQVAAKRALLAAYAGFAGALGTAHDQLKAGQSPGTVIPAMVRRGDAVNARYQPALRAVGEHKCLG